MNAKKHLFIICVLIVLFVIFKINEFIEFRIFLDRSSDYSNQFPNHKFQPIGNSSFGHLIYSAIFDNRNYSDINGVLHIVKVFVIFLKSMKANITCDFSGGNGFVKSVNSLSYLPHPEHHNKKFSPFIIECPLQILKCHKDEITKFPEKVSIKYAEDPLTISKSINIDILFPEKTTRTLHQRKLAVCIGPLQFNYSNVLRIVEFIEIYILLGAEKFYFYNNNATKNVLKLLKLYEKRGIVEVLPWNLNEYNLTEIHYGGIILTLNECFYRSTFVDGFEYTAMVDLDEILIPLQHRTLVDLLRKYDNDRINEINFRTVFFFQNYKNDTSLRPKNILNKFLYTQIKIERLQKPMPQKKRSKFIVKGRSATMVGNHYVWRSFPGTKRVIVSTADGLVFHYRDEELTEMANHPRQFEFQATRFGSTIWSIVDETCKLLFKDGICPLT